MTTFLVFVVLLVLYEIVHHRDNLEERNNKWKSRTGERGVALS
jgi:hypothetical protein